MISKEMFFQSNNQVKDVKSIMHYGGEVFDAYDKENKKIGTNMELSPLDIQKLNYYYPPISKLSETGYPRENPKTMKEYKQNLSI